MDLLVQSPYYGHPGCCLEGAAAASDATDIFNVHLLEFRLHEQDIAVTLPLATPVTHPILHQLSCHPAAGAWAGCQQAPGALVGGRLGEHHRHHVHAPEVALKMQ
jgi:hypothetical protein